jgi:hypothetical protein
VILKLNGGLGATMGLHGKNVIEIEIEVLGSSILLILPGPKSALEIRGDKTFLDYIVTQVEV